MTAKFTIGDQALEVTKKGNEIEFYVYHFDEEQIGQSIKLPISDMSDLIKHLQSLQRNNSGCQFFRNGSVNSFAVK